MTMMPPNRAGDTERVFWINVPHDLRQKVVSLDELQHLFPENRDFQPVEKLKEEEGYAVYGRRTKPITFSEFLAYECHHCNKLVMGPPEIHEFNTLAPLSGSKGYSVSCANCKEGFRTEDIVMS